MKKRTVNAAFIIKTHTRMARSYHRDMMTAKRYRDKAMEKHHRHFRDEHLAIAREVKRLADLEIADGAAMGWSPGFNCKED